MHGCNCRLAAILFDFAIKIKYVQDEQAIDGEDDSRGYCGMHRCAALVPHERIHGRSKQPELHYNANANQRQQRGKERGALCLTRAHAISTPTANISFPCCSSLMRGNGRVGGPAKGLPSSTEKYP
jgi:hypothetical protein